MVYFYIFNYSRVDDEKINLYIDNLFKELKIGNIELDYTNIFCNQKTKKRFEPFINSYDDQPLCDNDRFLVRLNNYFGEVSGQKFGDELKFIFLGEKVSMRHQWGDAQGTWLTVIGCMHEKNIWHEVAHLLGAKDNYGDGMNRCKNPDRCIMTYGKTEGVLCEEALAEIRNYISTLKG